jgi:hypothetical protein
MPKVREIFPQKFLRGADLTGARDVTVAGWRTEYLYGKDEHVLDLADGSTLRCGTNLANQIAAALDEDDLDFWPGRTFQIYPFPMKIKDRAGLEKDVVAIHAKASAKDVKPGNGKALSIRNSDIDDDIPY